MPPEPGVVTLRGISPELIARYAPCMQHALDDLLNSYQKERADYRGCIQHRTDDIFGG